MAPFVSVFTAFRVFGAADGQLIFDVKPLGDGPPTAVYSSLRKRRSQIARFAADLRSSFFFEAARVRSTQDSPNPSGSVRP
jgi:hypothetical protein